MSFLEPCGVPGDGPQRWPDHPRAPRWENSRLSAKRLCRLCKSVATLVMCDVKKTVQRSESFQPILGIIQQKENPPYKSFHVIYFFLLVLSEDL